MANEPKEIVSPITNKIIQTKTSDSDAHKQGRIPYDKPTPDNTVMLFIDHQKAYWSSAGNIVHNLHTYAW